MKAAIAGRIGMGMAALVLAATAMAQGPEAGMRPGFGPQGHRPPMEQAFGAQGEHGRWWNNQTLVDKYKLTDDQRKGMDAILLEHRSTLIDLHASLQKTELALEPLMKEDQPNEQQILAQIDKVAQARAELEKANARFLLALRGKLTPDQWKQVQADRAAHAQQRGAWGGHGPEGQNRENGTRPHGQFRHQPPPPPGAPGEVPQSMVDGPADVVGGI